MRDEWKKELFSGYATVRTLCKWLFVAGVIGLVGGATGAAFNLSVAGATAVRETHRWLIWLLPAGGAAIAWLYRRTRMESKNTDSIIDAVHFGGSIPPLQVPVIFTATVITHLFGGSAGREGAALQIGGGIGNGIGRIFRLSEKDMRLAVLCGMSAVFCALFGTPLAAAFFPMEVIGIGIFYDSGLVPCTVSSAVAYYISLKMGIKPAHYQVEAAPLSLLLLLRVALLGAVCAGVSVLFCLTMHLFKHWAPKLLGNVCLRGAVGGAAVILLTCLVGNGDYNGAGGGIIRAAVEQGAARPDAFLLKILFTAITLSCGFRGGEVVPTFFVGATLGCVAGGLLGIPAGFAAAIGLTAVFCGTVNCPVTALMLAIELFGSDGLLYYAVACAVSYFLSGYFSIYKSQTILYSKVHPEYLNIQAR